MKKIFYDNRIAKILLCMSSCDTITIGPFVCSKLEENEVGQYVRNHECTHSRQWIEMAVLSGIVIWMLSIMFDVSEWYFLISSVAFYLWYGIEWLVRAVLLRDRIKAYESVSFEREAYYNQYNPNYLENSNYFAWLKYVLSK